LAERGLGLDELDNNATVGVISVHSGAVKMHPPAARQEHTHLAEEQEVGEKAKEKSRLGENLEAHRQEDRLASVTPGHDAAFARSLEMMMNISSLAEGATLSSDFGDQFLGFVEWWSSNAERPVSVSWSPVGEARATTYRCGQRVVNLAHVTKEVAEKMLQLTNELGFLWYSLPPATRIARQMVENMVAQNGLIDKLEKGDLDSLSGSASYIQAANDARLMYNEVQKQKAAFDLPLRYSMGVAKTVSDIGTLIGMPPAAAPPSQPMLQQIQQMTAEGQAALRQAQPYLSGLQSTVNVLGMPALGVKIGNVNGALGELEVTFQQTELHANKMSEKSAGGLALHGLAVASDWILGSHLSPEDNIRRKLAKTAKDMAIYTRNLLRLYLDFEKKLIAYKDQFVRAVTGVTDTFTRLGVQVADFFRQLPGATLDTAQQVLNPTCGCVSL